MKKNINQAAVLPFSWFEWLIAWRYLRSRRKEGGISVIAWYALIGVTLGVGTLIVVQAVMLGFREEFTSKIIGANAHISIIKNYERNNKESLLFEYKHLTASINNLDEVVGAFPVIKGQVMGAHKGKNVGVQVFGINPEDLLLLSAVNKPELSRGNIDNFSDGVAVGSGIARNLNLQVGDKISLLSFDGIKTAFGTAPRLSEFKVTYIFRIGRYDIDNTRLYIPLVEAQRYFDKESGVDQIDVILSEPTSVDSVKIRITSIVEKEYLLWTWKDASGAFLKALDVERRVMLIILSLVILIAALNIISGLVMLVKNKTKDIAILRTIGFTQGTILRVFFYMRQSYRNYRNSSWFGLGLLICHLYYRNTTISGKYCWR
jgi:lipoprotein-releasing system permease protein